MHQYLLSANESQNSFLRRHPSGVRSLKLTLPYLNPSFYEGEHLRNLEMEWFALCLQTLSVYVLAYEVDVQDPFYNQRHVLFINLKAFQHLFVHLPSLVNLLFISFTSS